MNEQKKQRRSQRQQLLGQYTTQLVAHQNMPPSKARHYARVLVDQLHLHRSPQ